METPSPSSPAPRFIFLNPYDSRDTCDGHKLSARIPITEWAYIKRIYPMMPGLSDKLVSNLISLFIDFIKLHEKNHGPIDPAWTVDHPTYTLISTFFGRCKSGLFVGDDGARNELGATSSLCETVLSPSFVSTDSQSSASHRRNQTRSEASDSKKETGLGLSSDGPTPSNQRKSLSLESELLRLDACGE